MFGSIALSPLQRRAVNAFAAAIKTIPAPTISNVPHVDAARVTGLAVTTIIARVTRASDETIGLTRDSTSPADAPGNFSYQKQINGTNLYMLTHLDLNHGLKVCAIGNENRGYAGTSNSFDDPALTVAQNNARCLLYRPIAQPYHHHEPVASLRPRLMLDEPPKP